MCQLSATSGSNPIEVASLSNLVFSLASAMMSSVSTSKNGSDEANYYLILSRLIPFAFPNFEMSKFTFEYNAIAALRIELLYNPRNELPPY